MDSGFCVLIGLSEMKKMGGYRSALIKKRRYWPKGIHGDGFNEYFMLKARCRLSRCHWHVEFNG